MKNYTLFLWIALLMLGISGTIGAREVASFNDGWEFKKGPFSKEALQAVQKWNSDWQEVSIHILGMRTTCKSKPPLSMKV